jgi:hypothetical protein
MIAALSASISHLRSDISRTAIRHGHPAWCQYQAPQNNTVIRSETRNLHQSLEYRNASKPDSIESCPWKL